MRKITPVLLAISASFLLFSCQKDESLSSLEEPISEATLSQIKAHGFGTSAVKKHEDGFLVEGDIVLTQEFLNSKPEGKLLRVAQAEQYRTTNLVTGTPRAITVSVSGRNVTQRLIDATKAAIDRYNAENLSLTFVYGGKKKVRGGINISVVTKSAELIAEAGFPTSDGSPYSSIKFNSQYNGAPLDFVTTVIAHELGHCIGFRHTDYMDRSYSCGGSPSNEGALDIGAIEIPGTPTGPDPNSWMLACLSGTTDRPFNANDKAALNHLY